MSTPFEWHDDDLEELRKMVKNNLNIKENKSINVKPPQTPKLQSQQKPTKKELKTPTSNVKRIKNDSVQTKTIQPKQEEIRRTSVAPNFAKLHQKETERISKFRNQHKLQSTTPCEFPLSTGKKRLNQTEEFVDAKEFFSPMSPTGSSYKPKSILKNILNHETPMKQDPKIYDESPSRVRSQLQSPSNSMMLGFSKICKTPSDDFNKVLQNYGMSKSENVTKKPVFRKIRFESEAENVQEIEYEPSDFVKKLLQETLK
jgi:hypothetical protein